MIDILFKIFYKCTKIFIDEVKDLPNQFMCLSDQCVWTRIMVDHPELFNRVGVGYGEIVNILY